MVQTSCQANVTHIRKQQQQKQNGKKKKRRGERDNRSLIVCGRDHTAKAHTLTSCTKYISLVFIQKYKCLPMAPLAKEGCYQKYHSYIYTKSTLYIRTITYYRKDCLSLKYSEGILLGYSCWDSSLPSMRIWVKILVEARERFSRYPVTFLCQFPQLHHSL